MGIVKSEEKTKNRVDNIDVLKAICAFGVVCIHVPFPGTIGEYFTTLTRIAVPIFFMITGYFYPNVERSSGKIKQIKKILILMIKANLIYFLWNIVYAAIGQNIEFYLKDTFTLKNLRDFLLFNESPLREHLWYLGAILYVLVIVFVADRLKCRKLLYILTPILLLGDLILGKYSLVIWGREFPYIFVRNFLFVGIPYFCIGLMVRNGFGQKIKRSLLKGLVVLFIFTSLFERFILVSINMNATRDHYLSTTFLAVMVFLLALQNNKNSVFLAVIGRKYSTWLYIMHPIFITCIGVVARKAGIYECYRFIAPIVVYFITLVFLILIERIKVNCQRLNWKKNE